MKSTNPIITIITTIKGEYYESEMSLQNWNSLTSKQKENKTDFQKGFHCFKIATNKQRISNEKE